MYETDYTAEISKPIRRLVTALLVLIAVASAACFVLVVVIAAAREAPIGPLYGSLVFFGLLAYGSVWMAYRLLHGQRSKNGRTIMPEWFIRFFGVVFLIGVCITATLQNSWFLGGAIAAAFAMIRIRSHLIRKQTAQSDS